MITDTSLDTRTSADTRTSPDTRTSIAPAVSPHTRVSLVPVSAALWRVVDPRGRAMGHLQRLAEPQGERFRARRFHVASGAFRDVGEFWSAQDAVDALRYSS